MPSGARVTVPPKAAPMAWCPRQTPKIGTLPPWSRTTSTQTPASSGVPGPGERRIPSKPRAKPFEPVDLGQVAREVVSDLEGRLHQTGGRVELGELPTLEADLYDGSDVVTLVFLGRRSIAGIEPGRQLTAKGRIAIRDGRKVIYNPYYELEAPR